MTAKEYLQQVYKINQKIKRLTKRRDDIRADMFSIGSPAGHMDTDRVQTSLSGDKMLNLIAKVDALERDILEEISQLTDTKNTICRQIERVRDERYKNILFQRYVLLKSWEAIAVDLDYHIKWVYKLHGEALQAFKREILEGKV